MSCSGMKERDVLNELKWDEGEIGLPWAEVGWRRERSCMCLKLRGVWWRTYVQWIFNVGNWFITRRLAKNWIYFPFYKVSRLPLCSYAEVSNFLGVIFCWASLLWVTLTLLFSFTQQSQAPLTVQPSDQCSGSVTFGYGSGSVDLYLWLTDPDPDSALFVINDPQDNKK